MEEQFTWNNIDILTERPKDMPYEEYHNRRKVLKELLKAYKKGTFTKSR